MMFRSTIILILLLSSFSGARSQTDSAKVYPDFRFSDGIYLTFDDFKNNRPVYTNFEIKYRNGSTYLYIMCADSSRDYDCEVKQPWGYCQNSNVFIHQGYGDNYFRLQVIGALIHYFVIEMQYYDPSFPDPFNPYSTSPNRRITNRELVMEWETGRRFEFCYKNFKVFLGENDPEMLQQLESSKKKRKMIYYFMLQYNSKHPVYIKQN